MNMYKLFFLAALAFTLCRSQTNETDQTDVLRAFFEFYYSEGTDIPKSININSELKIFNKFPRTSIKLSDRCEVCRVEESKKVTFLDSKINSIFINDKSVELKIAEYKFLENNVWYFSPLIETSINSIKGLQFVRDNLGERIYGIVTFEKVNRKFEFHNEIFVDLVN